MIDLASVGLIGQKGKLAFRGLSAKLMISWILYTHRPATPSSA